MAIRVAVVAENWSDRLFRSLNKNNERMKKMVKPISLCAAIPLSVLLFSGCASNKSVYQKSRAAGPNYPRATSSSNGSQYVRTPPRTVATASGKPVAPASVNTSSTNPQNSVWADSEKIWEKGYSRNWLISSVYKGYYSNVIRYSSGGGEKIYALCDAKWHLVGMMTAMHSNYCPGRINDDYLLEMVGKMRGIESMCVMFKWARWIGDVTARKNPSLTREFTQAADDARIFHERHGCDSRESVQFFGHVQDFFTAAAKGVAGLEPKNVAGQVPLFSQREEYFKATLWAGESDAEFGRLKALEAQNARLLRCEYGPVKSDGTVFATLYFWLGQLPNGYDSSLKGTNPIHSVPSAAATFCPSGLPGGRTR